MNGMEILLKSLGIDPEQIQAQMKEFLSSFQAYAQSIEARLARIEAKIDAQAAEHFNPMGNHPYAVDLSPLMLEMENGIEESRETCPGSISSH